MARRWGTAAERRSRKSRIQVAGAFLRRDFRFRFASVPVSRKRSALASVCLARVVGGDRAEIGRADFNVIAEDLVVAHLERANAGPFLAPGAGDGQPSWPSTRSGAEFFQRGMITGANQPPSLANRRVVRQRARVEIGQIGQRRVIFAPSSRRAATGCFPQRLAQSGQLFERHAQGDQVARRCRYPERGAQRAVPRRAPGAGAPCKWFRFGLSPSPTRPRFGGRAMPGRFRKARATIAAKASTAGGHRAIDAERSVVWPERRAADQTSSRLRRRGGVENEHIFPLPEAQGVDMPERPAQFMPEIMEQSSRRAEGTAGRAPPYQTKRRGQNRRAMRS